MPQDKVNHTREASMGKGKMKCYNRIYNELNKTTIAEEVLKRGNS